MTIKKKTISVKATVKKRTLNPSLSMSSKTTGSPFQEADPKRRLGQFESAGEHSRVGGRTSGIVGQNKKRFQTDKKRKKSV
jgi:hypothetical protein